MGRDATYRRRPRRRRARQTRRNNSSYVNVRAEMATSRLRISTACIRLFVSAGGFTHEVTHSRYYGVVVSPPDCIRHRSMLLHPRDDEG